MMAIMVICMTGIILNVKGSDRDGTFENEQG